MKQSLSLFRFSKFSGFTLVELLVVIGIISILASVILFAGGTALRAAKRAQATNTANAIQTAALSYYTEYGIYPIPVQATPADILIGDSSSTDGASWATLVCVLSGNVSPTGLTFTPPTTSVGPCNSRGIAFLSLRSSDVFSAADVTANSHGVQDAPKNPLPTSTTAALFFNIAFDGDYSGVIGDAASAVNGKLPNFAKSTITAMDYTGTSTAGVAVWANCNGSTSTTNPNFWVHTY